MTKKIWQTVYRHVVWPLTWLVFQLLSRKNQKIRLGLQMRRLNSNGQPRWASGIKNLRPIWIHCASGEFEYAKPVITAIKEREPRAKILVTYFSPSAAKSVSLFPGVDIASPSPWESQTAVRALIEHHRPQVLLLARTDTWPEMLDQAKAHGIPSLLFSSTLSLRSGRMHPLIRLITRLVLSDLTQVFCVSEEDLAVFEALGLGARTRVAGDTRYDQVLARLQEPKAIKDELFSSSHKPILVAGSTWPEDEAVLLEALLRLKDKIQCVLVPHEPTASHLETLESELNRLNLSSVRYSQAQKWTNENVLLVDQVGILAELYQKGHFAFVGGSFKKTVHSVMEPLAAGALTFVGPQHKNNREAISLSQILCNGNFHCVEVVHTAAELSTKLVEATQAFSAKDAAAIGAEILERAGKSGQVAEWALARAQFAEKT